MRRSIRNITICLLTIIYIHSAVSGSAPVISSGAWQPTGTLSSARAGAAASLLLDGRILVSGGNSANGPVPTADFINADGTVSPAPPMVYARSGHISATLQDGRILVAGGVTAGGSATSTAEIFDPVTNSWSSAGVGMNEARSGATAALLEDGRVAVAGGQNGSAISSTIEIFDPNTAAFMTAGMMSSPRTQHAMTVLQDGRVLIVGGFNGAAPIASTDIFDPVASTISAGPALSVARFGHSATTLLNGVVAVIGGNNGIVDPQQEDATPTEIVDPSATTPAFTTVGANLATPREGHLAILLPNNYSVLIAGGASAGTVIASAELFTAQDSATGVWSYGFTSTGTMTAARSGACASANQVNAPSTTMARDGVVVVAGGNGASGIALNTTETYGYPTVQTDQGDYPPGSIVTITGSGFQPGEAVTLQLVESPLIDTHGPYTVQADASGNISDSSFVTDSHDANVLFYLAAVGQSSARQAQTAFHDTTNITAATVTMNESTCTTPMSSFGQGQTVCAKVVVTGTGGGGGAGTFNIHWLNPSNSEVQNTSEPVPAAPPTTFTDTLATTVSSPTGTWTVKVCTSQNCSGGNLVATATFTLQVADHTAPVVTITFPAPVYGTNGWFNGQDTVPVVGSVSATDPSNVASISCSDSVGGLSQGALSGGGTTTATASLTVSGEGTHSISCLATDGANNNGAAAGSTVMPVVIKIDTQAPTSVVGAAGRPADHNGWFTDAVTIAFSGTDSTSGIASCTSTNYSGPDSATAFVSGHCTDNAGNQSSDVPFSFKYDSTPPTAVALSVTAGTAGTNGWYTSDVTVHTSGTELVSLPLSCTPDQFQTAETTGQVFNGSCTNDAGLSASAAPLTIKLDKSGPTATLNATGTLGNNGWYTSDVTISTTGSDTISNPTTCTADQTQTTDTAGQTFNGSCTNDAGLKTDASPLTIKRDATPPTITLKAPANGEVYFLNAAIAANYTCSDAMSGVATCSAPVPSGSDFSTSPVGPHSFTVTATDEAGNIAIPMTNNYSIQFATCLLYDPMRAVKSNATYPLKLYLCDAANNDVSSAAIVVHATSTYMVSAFTGTPEDSGNANPDSDFRFDPTLGPSGGYIFNLQTKGLSGGSYGYTFTATGDTATHTVMPGFGVK